MQEEEMPGTIPKTVLPGIPDWVSGRGVENGGIG